MGTSTHRHTYTLIHMNAPACTSNRPGFREHILIITQYAIALKDISNEGGGGGGGEKTQTSTPHRKLV